MSAVVWGQPALFVVGAGGEGLRFRVRADGGEFVPVVSSLVLAAAQARAIAVAGGTAVVASSAGTVASVRWVDGRFVVVPWGPGSWPSRCGRLLSEHGHEEVQGC
ncbi:MAG: hypothetical protein AB7O92_12015 [Acidimicrobiia bacterium]